MYKFTFIDLFAGIGGFHIAMRELGGECLFASEIDSSAVDTYRVNFGISPAPDIRGVSEQDIPKHDLLCAGFPCQAFSKAGRQEGFEDTRGTLFFEILRILNHQKPKYILLENVRNLVGHDGGRTWHVMHGHLERLGYLIPSKPIILSPHQMGVPQLRDRVFIPGILRDYTNLNELRIESPRARRNLTHPSAVLTEVTSDEYSISPTEEYVLTAWDEFLQGLKRRSIGFPVWANAFLGQTDISGLPGWKQEFTNKNRELYLENKTHIDRWLSKYNNLNDFSPTHTKFEWQAGNSISSVWEGIIQFRPSGVRVKRPTEFPALVAMVHIPIVGWERRRLTPREVANLQSFPPDFIVNPNRQQAYKQFGNSVNVAVVRHVAQQLLEC